MDRVKGLWKQARAMVFRRTAEQELAEEMAFHLDMATAENQRRGMRVEEARRMAMISFGGRERFAERVREGRWTRWLEDLVADLGYGVRMLARRPGFTAAVVATLALGIGGTTAIFSVVDGLFLRAPMGVADASSVRRVYIVRDEGMIQSPGGGPGSWVDYVSMREVPAFAAIGAMIGPQLLDLNRGEEAVQLRAAAVSAGFLEMLGVRPALGRLFTAAEDEVVGAHPVGLISHRLWQARFGGATDVLGRTLLLNGTHIEIIGVTQAGFDGITADPVEVWLPSAICSAVGMMSGSEWRTMTGMASIHYAARLAPGVSDSVAAAQAATALRHAAAATPELDPTPEAMTTALVPAARPGGSKAADLSLWLALVAGLVLVIACANVANLLLARAIARRRELAVRLSLGAGRWRVARQHLTESLLLAVLGGAGGVIVTYWSLRLMQQFPLPPSAGRLDARLLLFALGLTLVTGLLFGALPAVRASQFDPVRGLRDSRAVGALASSRTRRALVVLQVSLSLVLLVGAGLFVRSLNEVNAIDGGVDTDRLLTVSVNLRRAGFSEAEREAFYDAALQRLATMPRVERAAIVHFAPYYRGGMGIWWELPGRSTPEDVEGPYINMVGPSYFETAGTRLLSGRAISESDVPGGEPVAVVNEAMARLLADDGAAVGICVPFEEQVDGGGCTRIVGIVETQRRRILDDKQVPVVFLARAQAPNAVTWGGPALLVRVAGDPGDLAGTVRAALQSLRGDLPFLTVQPLTEEIRNDVLPFRLGATLFTMFSVLALLLAAVGLNGVLGYFVTERTHEIGIRRSLGAPVRGVMGLVVRQGMMPVMAGIVIGLAAAFIGTRLLASLLFGVEARDPFVFVGAPAFLIVIALLAALVPARRASRVSPMVALRQDG
jgi:putative ABC transport system permease protein